MSRKRDTNWTRDEIKVLLDSIMEITKTRAADGKRTNSREVFEYAAKKMGERGHSSRAEREKCRTKWKKMKEEFTHAKRAREGDNRFKEAPGIQPFYERMKEFIDGNFDNISPHSTIVRRTPSLSNKTHRASARIAASTASSNDTEYPENSSVTPGSNTSSNTNLNSNITPIGTNPQHAIPNGQTCIYTTYNTNSQIGNIETSARAELTSADISYRVSSGCRQITIFGDHDVDIKFRGDCVTINKIDVDLPQE